MPNRLIKESICTSEDLNKLSPEAEILFYRLLVQADDYGCYFGNPSLVKSRCLPLRSDEIHSEQVDSWLDEIERAGLIIRYTAADGRDYCQFVKWSKHQRVRQSEHKYPQYDETNCKLKSSRGNSPQVAANGGEMRPNPIQSESNTIQSEIESNPTVKDVEEFALSRNSKVKAKDFFDYYSPEWKDGDGKSIKSWKKLFISWERRLSDGCTGDPPESEDRFGHLRYDNE